jgi:hypothetical protein
MPALADAADDDFAARREAGEQQVNRGDEALIQARLQARHFGKFQLNDPAGFL